VPIASPSLETATTATERSLPSRAGRCCGSSSRNAVRFVWRTLRTRVAELRVENRTSCAPRLLLRPTETALGRKVEAERSAFWTLEPCKSGGPLPPYPAIVIKQVYGPAWNFR